MKKIYVFNNWFTKKKGESYKSIEVEAETILEAKKKVKEQGYENMCFIRINPLQCGLKYCDMDKCCGNCKHFKDEDANGKGWCEHYERSFRCEEVACKAHCLPNNGWTEITPDNVKEVYNIGQNRLVVQDARNDCYPIIRMIRDFSATISTMAKCGGYYYYVLPELKLEETK